MANALPQRLADVFRRFDACQRCKRKHNALRHIMGVGKYHGPRFLLCFINPTHLNISSHPDYKGHRRFPFIGVRHCWRFLAEPRFIDAKIAADIYKRGWRLSDENLIAKSLASHGLYLTNLVKCAQENPENPDIMAIKQDLPLFFKEISIVDPKYIIAFGALPFRHLTGRPIRLADVFREMRRKTLRPVPSIPINGKSYPVLPCYFPFGRGNRHKAMKMLKYYDKKINRGFP